MWDCSLAHVCLCIERTPGLHIHACIKGKLNFMLFRWLVKLNSLKHTSEELKEKLNIIVIHDFSCTIAFHSISF